MARDTAWSLLRLSNLASGKEYRFAGALKLSFSACYAQICFSCQTDWCRLWNLTKAGPQDGCISVSFPFLIQMLFVNSISS